MRTRAEIYDLEQLGFLDEAEELSQQLGLRAKDIAQVERERRAEREAEKHRKRLARNFQSRADRSTPDP